MAATWAGGRERRWCRPSSLQLSTMLRCSWPRVQRQRGVPQRRAISYTFPLTNGVRAKAMAKSCSRRPRSWRMSRRRRLSFSRVLLSCIHLYYITYRKEGVKSKNRRLKGKCQRRATEPPRPRGVPWGPQLVSELQSCVSGGHVGLILPKSSLPQPPPGIHLGAVKLHSRNDSGGTRLPGERARLIVRAIPITCECPAALGRSVRKGASCANNGTQTTTDWQG